jgi:hypothetical protein
MIQFVGRVYFGPLLGNTIVIKLPPALLELRGGHAFPVVENGEPQIVLLARPRNLYIGCIPVPRIGHQLNDSNGRVRYDRAGVTQKPLVEEHSRLLGHNADPPRADSKNGTR